MSEDQSERRAIPPPKKPGRRDLHEDTPGGDRPADRPRLLGTRFANSSMLSYVFAAIDNLAGIALLLMLASVLLPAAYYSYHLKDPTASQLLIAICIGLFSSLLFLWIMDAVSILRFRAEWVSKSVYGAAIVSILGTSVGVYQRAFSANKYPYEGRWSLRLIDSDQSVPIVDLDVGIVYSERSGSYWGYSEYKPPATPQKDIAIWATLNDFSPSDGGMVLAWFEGNGNQRSLTVKVNTKRDGKLFEGEDGTKIIRLSRAKLNDAEESPP